MASPVPVIQQNPQFPSVLHGQLGDVFGGANVNVATSAVAIVLRPAGGAADTPPGATSAEFQILNPTADINVTMPDSALVPGKSILIRNTTATANVLTILRHANDGGGTLQFVAPGEEKRFVSTGAALNNWQLVQHQPTTANTNDAALAGNVVLGSSELLARQYQNLDPGGANRAVTLPLSDNSPGEVFHVRNNADAFEILTLLPNGGDPVPADGVLVTGARVLYPGDEITVVSVPGLGFITVDKRRSPTTRVSAAAGTDLSLVEGVPVALQVAAAIYHEIAVTEGADTSTERIRNVLLPVAALNFVGRRIVIRNSSTTFDAVLRVQTSVPADLIRLAPNEVAEFVLTTVATDWELTGLWRSATIAQQGALIGAAKVLSSGAPTYQFLDPAAAVAVVTLPAAASSPNKRFIFRNIGDGAGERLDITAVAADQNAVIASLFPGDEIEAVSTGVAGAGANQGWQLASTALRDGFTLIAGVGGAATQVLLDNGPLAANQHTGNVFSVTHDNTAGIVRVDLPVISAFNRGRLFVFLVEVGDAVGEDVEIHVAAGATVADVQQATVGANGRQTVLIMNNGAAWQLLMQSTLAL